MKLLLHSEKNLNKNQKRINNNDWTNCTSAQIGRITGTRSAFEKTLEQKVEESASNEVLLQQILAVPPRFHDNESLQHFIEEKE
jgi:hypothetical protein